SLYDHARTVGWSPDGKQLGAAAADETLVLWDGETYAEQYLLRHAGSSILWSPDGGRLASTCTDFKDQAAVRVNVLDPRTGQRVQSFDARVAPGRFGPRAYYPDRSLTWADGGQQLLYVDTVGLRTFDTATATHATVSGDSE